MSQNFERWKELAALVSKEHDPEKLTELANEMNRALTQSTPQLRSRDLEHHYRTTMDNPFVKASL